MPPQSRGPQRPNGFQQSKSSPNLTTIRDLTPRHSLDHNPHPTSPYLNPTLNGFGSDDDDISTDEDDEDHEEGEGEAFPPLDAHEREELYTTRSHPHLPPSASQLFPPFYNRPPTPLPPSPSLTSLLRPSFSTHTSHHTTPESSDTESGSTSAFPAPSSSKGRASSSVTGVHRPRSSAHPKVPTYEYYGFALYLASSLFFLMYTLWAYLPSPFLHQLGIYYYPNRWWALAIPCWLVVLVLWIYAALQSYNTGRLTLGMGSIECVVDEAGKVAILDSTGRVIRERGKSRFAGEAAGKGGKRKGGGGGAGVKKVRSRQGSLKEEKVRYVPADLGREVQWRTLWSEGTDAVLDVPLGGVCEILYGEGREVDEFEDEDFPTL
jgi:phosphatidylinositol glycan class P protein